MAYDPTEIDALRARLGWTTPEEEEGLWDTLTQPIKGFLGATGNIGGQIAGLLAPQAYEAAAQELQQDLGVGPDASLLERAEALPGLGDVGAQLIPESVRQSWAGTALGPMGRMAGNILGDPTTYTPFILGKVGTAVAKGIPAAEAAVTAARAAKTAEQAMAAQSAFQKAVEGASMARRAGVWAYQHRMPIDKAMALGGLAYAPEIVEGIGQSASEAWRLAQEQKYGEAVATGVGGAFLAGLAGLMGKGAIDGIKATGHLKQWLAENHPDIAKAAEAAEAGEIPPGALDQAEQAVGQMAMFPGVEPSPIRPTQLEPEQLGLDLSQQMEMLGGPEGLRLGSPRMEPGVDVLPQAGGPGQLGLFDEQGRRMAQGEPMLFPDLEGPRPLPGTPEEAAALSARAAAGPEQLALFGPKGGIGRNVVTATRQVEPTAVTKGLETKATEPVEPAVEPVAAAPTPEVAALPEVPAAALTAAQKAFDGGKGKAHHKQAAATRALMQAGVPKEEAQQVARAIRDAADRGERIAPESSTNVPERGTEPLTDEQAARELEAAAEEPGYVTDPDPRAVQLFEELSTTERVENPDGTVDYVREGKILTPEDAQRQADTFTSLPREDQQWLARELGAKPDDLASELQAPAAAAPPAPPAPPSKPPGGGEPPAPRPEPPAVQPTKRARYVGELKYGPEKMAEYAETRALEAEYQRLTEEERVKPGQQPAQRRKIQLLQQELTNREDVPADAFEFAPEPEVKDWQEPLRQPPRPKLTKTPKRQPFEGIQKGMRRAEDLAAVWDEAEASNMNKGESAQTLTRSFDDPEVAGHLVKADDVRRRLPEKAAKAHQDAVRKLLLEYGKDPKMQQDLILSLRKLNEDVDFLRQMLNRRSAIDKLTDEDLEAFGADYRRFKEIQGHDEWKALNKKRRLKGEEKKANPLSVQEEALIKEYERLKKSVSRRGGEGQLVFEIARVGTMFGSKNISDIKLSLRNFEAGKFDKLVDAAKASVEKARRAGERGELPEDVEIKLGNALRRAQDQVTGESRYAEEFRDVLQERAAKMARDLKRNPEIEWNGETVRMQDLSEVDLIKKLMAVKSEKATLDRMRRLRREEGLEVKGEGGETRLAPELTDEQMARILAKDLQTEGTAVAPEPEKPPAVEAGKSPNAEAIADLPEGRLKGGQGKTAWQITRRQLERYDLAASPVERGGMGLKGEELQEFVLERRPTGGDRNLVGKNVGTGKIGAVWKKFIRGEEGEVPKFAGEWDAKVGKFLDEFGDLSDVRVDDELRSQLHSIFKSFLSSRAAEEIKPGQRQFQMPNMARLKKALQDLGVSIADSDGRPRVMERLAEYLDPSGKLKEELLGVAGAVRKSAGKEAVLSERLGQLETHGVRTIGGRKVSHWEAGPNAVRFEAVEKSRGQEIHLSGTKGEAKSALRQFVETQREKGLKKILIGTDEFTPEVRDAMRNLREAGLVTLPEPPTFLPGPAGISRDTRVYEVKPPVKMGSSVTTPKLSPRHADLHARLDSTMMDNAHLIEGLAETLPPQFRRKGSTVLEDAKRVVLSAVRSVALGRSMFHGRQPVTELSFRDAKAGGLTVLSPEVLKQKGVVKVGDRYFRHDPLRTLIRSVFFKPDADIFGELRGAGHALQKAQQAARVVRDTDPVMVSRGSFNGTWDIGADASGQRYVIKMSTLDDHLRLAEDSVSGLGEIMAPVVRSGITPEGLTWRVEKLGAPVAVRDMEGVTIYPRSLSPAQQAALAAADAKVRDLAAKGKVMLSSSYGPHQFAFIDGKPRLVDRNSVIPTSQRRKIDRYVAQLMTNEKTDLDLTPRERFLRESQYEAAIRDGHKMESGVVANFDVDYGKEVTSRLAGAVGAAGARSLSRITKAISDLAGAEAEFGGVTMSPYLRGQYVNGKVFVNLVEELEANGGDVAGAARQGVFSLIHEIVHDMVDDAGHGSVFRAAHEDLLLKLEGKVDEWADELTEALDHDELAGLLPYYKEASLNGGIGRENWRDAEGVGGVPPRTPEGGAPGAADRRLAGEAGAEADRGAGLRPGEAVQEGGRRPTGQLGRASPFGRGDGGTADTSSYVTQRDRQAGGRLASRSAGAKTVDEGIALVRELTDVKGVSADDAARAAVTTAFQIARRMQKADPDAFKDILIKPSPRGKGEVWARFNMENVEGLSDTTRGAIKIWSEITRNNPKLSRHFDADKVRTWDELDDEVRKLIGANSRQDLLKMLGSRKGLTDTEVVLARMLGTDLIRGVQEADRDLLAAQLGRAKGEVTAGQLETAMQRYNFALDNFAVNMEKVLNPVTGVGRALAAAKKIARSLDPHMAMWQDMRAGMLERLRPRYKDFDELTRVVDHLMAIAADGFNRGDLQNFADEFRRAMKFSMADKLLEAFKAGLLGWKSRAANIASNTLVQGVRELERNVANVMENVVSRAKGQTPESALSEFKLNSMVISHWKSTAIPEWARAQKDAFMLKPEDYNNLIKFGTLAEDFNIVVGAIPGKFGEFIRFTLKGMNAEDALFKKMSQLQYYYRQTHRNIRHGVEGFTKLPGESIEAATARIVKDLENYSLQVEAGQQVPRSVAKRFAPMREEGIRIAREETFQKDLPPVLKSIVQGMATGHGRWAQLIFPFVRTPWNIAVETVKRTPLGFLDVASKWEGMSRMERMDALSRPMVGTAIGAAVYMAALENRFTGGGPIDPEAEANKRLTGWQPYSIKTKNGWVSYQRLEPMSSIMGMAADLAEGVKEGDFSEGQFRSGMVRLIGSVTENLTNKTFLSGLEGLVTALSDPIRYGERWVKQQQGAWIPNTFGPIPFGHLAQAVDDTYRQTDAFTMSPFIAKIPFASKTLEPQLTPTGEERKRPGSAVGRLLSPTLGSEARKDYVAVAAELMDDVGAPPVPPKRYTYVKGVRVWFTPEERRVLAQAQQNATKFIGARLAKDPNFLRLPDNEDVAPLGAKTKKDVIKGIYDNFRKQAMASINPRLIKRAAGHTGGEARI